VQGSVEPCVVEAAAWRQEIAGHTEGSGLCAGPVLRLPLVGSAVNSAVDFHSKIRRRIHSSLCRENF